jgi:hypothetical protein
VKKILITGMNQGQSTRDFFERQVLKVVPSHYGLIRCLEDMGYEVDHRKVQLGEDISHYDDMIMYLHTPKGYCQNIYKGLYALSQRPDAIIAYDDWQIDQITDGLDLYRRNLTGELAGDPYKAWFMDLQQGLTVEEAKKWHSSYKDAMDIALGKKNRLLISAFAGGDMGKLKLQYPSDRVFTFNPNPYHYNRTPQNQFLAHKGNWDSDVYEKRREWNFASLLHNKTKSWLKKQKASWPINYYGQRKGENKTERLTEDRMCHEYASQWGCFMPGYHHSGSGWWRARPLQVADAGSILVCDDAEGAIYSEAHVGIRAHDVEQMDESQLRTLASRQREGLYERHPLDKDITRRELSAILEARR